ITDPHQLQNLINTLPNLTAVIHTAGTLHDTPLHKLTPENLHHTLTVKAHTAHHLHQLTQNHPITHFITYSSLTGTIGNPGQTAYAAANAYLDTLTTHRHHHHQPATSIAWGPWHLSTGMTAHLTTTDHHRITTTGTTPLTTTHALQLLDTALTTTTPTLIAANLNPTTLHRARVRRRAGGLAGLPAREVPQAALRLVREQVAAVLGHTGAASIDADRPFTDLGFDSLTALELRNRLAAAAGLALPASLVFDHPSPQAVADHLTGRLTARGATVTATATTRTDEPIAIVAMACRLPGDVSTPEQLWQMLADGRDAIGDFPTNRGWNLDHLFHPDPDHAGTSYVSRGGFLHDADRFDPEFFGISPREALATDPQQRLLLETTWEALERAGIDPHSLNGTSTGVFTGLMYHDYAGGSAPNGYEGQLLTGVSGSVASGRIAYTYGLEGPAVTVDTACSSSLVAIHLAAQSLRSGECSLALAGGVTVVATPNVFIGFSRQRGLSPDGRCKAFADNADGTGWAEGAGMLLLEKLS
ncbi:beta-ketoacyl synthase N-terminal-like domain-containing protein, partial [Dactylosporangium sp. NPDC000555]|uniref:beta-ketoacyl reductase n=1 Tax=Dactylosporangium sp. NPDC000555 TaxID=3154260 RepID=UPI00332031DD